MHLRSNQNKNFQSEKNTKAGFQTSNFSCAESHANKLKQRQSSTFEPGIIEIIKE